MSPQLNQCLNSKLDSYQKIRPLYRFAIHGILLYIAWLFFYKFLRYSGFVHIYYELITEDLSTLILYISNIYMHILGYETQLQGKILRIIGTGGVYLDRGCIGRNLMGLFAGFIIAYPSGRFIHKIWYVPLGVWTIIFINTARVSGLVLISSCCPEYIGINHDVIFKYTVYASTFLLWYIWIKKFSTTKPSPNNK